MKIYDSKIVKVLKIIEHQAKKEMNRSRKFHSFFRLWHKEIKDAP